MKIDWQQLMHNLRTEGVSAAVASRKIGRNQSVGQRLAREGGEPKFSEGLVLLNLHLDRCGIDKHREIVRTA